MKRTLYVLALAAAMLVSPAYSKAQTGVYCHKTDDYTEVCEFTDGRVNETTAFPDRSGSSVDYTAHEWAQHLAARAKHNRWTPQKSVDSCLSGYAQDVCTRISKACEGTSPYTKAQCGKVSDHLNKAAQ
jgi:hypothetical protein